LQDLSLEKFVASIYPGWDQAYADVERISDQITFIDPIPDGMVVYTTLVMARVRGFLRDRMCRDAGGERGGAGARDHHS
jgi:hypothetical protein